MGRIKKIRTQAQLEAEFLSFISDEIKRIGKEAQQMYSDSMSAGAVVCTRKEYNEVSRKYAQDKSVLKAMCREYHKKRMRELYKYCVNRGINKTMVDYIFIHSN